MVVSLVSRIHRLRSVSRPSGELLHAEINLLADQTGVYSTEGLFGSDTNPLVIHFAVPVDDFSVFIANGDSANQTHTVSDNLGDTVSVMLALSGSTSNSARTVSLPGSGITTVSIASANADFWNFAIDNVQFDAVPEPDSTLLVLGGLALIHSYRRAIVGSTRMALRAGTRQATRATATSSAIIRANVAQSAESTLNNTRFNS